MRTTSDPKVAVIGAGWIAEHGHLPGYEQAGVKVAAIADVEPAAAGRMAESFGIAHTYDSWREMLDEERPDVVSICVPNMLHAELAIGSLQSGAHVLCEKPLATSVADARAMFDAARAGDLLLMANQSTRFQPDSQLVRETVESGALGHIYHAEAVYARRLGIPTWGSFTRKASSFGGALCDIGVHSLDLAVWLIGNPPAVSVSAAVEMRFGMRPEVAELGKNAWDPALFDVEDFATAFVRFENGATLSLRTSWAAHMVQNERYVRLLGTDAGLTTDPPTVFRAIGGDRESEVLPAVEPSPGWSEAVAHFLAAVAGQATLLVTEDETMNVQRILNAAYESAELKREVAISTN